VLDLAALVAVAAQQRPFVTEHRGQAGLGERSDATDSGSRRRLRAKPAQPADRERAPQPGEPVPVRASPISRTARPADQ